MSAKRYSFVVFSDDWGRHPSSCQHLFRRIARNHRVLWVNTIGMRAPRADRFTICRGLEKLCEWTKPPRQVGENMWVLAPVLLPATHEGHLRRLSIKMGVAAIRRTMRKLKVKDPILWTSVPTANDYVGRLSESAVVYYVTDDYELWPGGNVAAIRKADQELTGRSDLILACSESLAASHRSAKAKTALLPHAVDFEHLATMGSEPEELSGIPRPRACFFGLMYEKIDLSFLCDLARQMPQLQLVMIGPVRTSVSQLAAMPNVHFLGAKPYAELPRYLHAMDVMLMPYVLDGESSSKGPLKIRECLAVGKPTVARAIPDLEAFADVVHLYRDRDGFVQTVRRALMAADAGLSKRMQDRVRGETWEARASSVMDQLSGLVNCRYSCNDKTCFVTTSRTQPDWRDYLSRHPKSTLFHDARWGNVMEKAYGNSPFYLTAWRGDKPVGVLQLVAKESILFRSHLCSLPYFDAAGILSDDEQATAALIRHARRLMDRLNVGWVELRHTAPICRAPTCRTDKVALRLPVPGCPDALWEALKPKVRNQVRKAERAGLTVCTGGVELLAQFHNVYTQNMRDLGSPPHSRHFFHLLIETFQAVARLFVVRSGRRAVAGALTLKDRCYVHVPWAASDWRAKALCPNMFLYWSLLCDACESGAEYFDFGRSTRGSGTYRFKTQWNAQEVPLYWEYLTASEDHTAGLRPDSTKYRAAAACWRRLPVSFAREVGPYAIAKLS